jgi:hypothetical protein
MSTAVSINTPDLEQRALTLPEQARAVVITDQYSYGVAVEKLLGVAALRQEIVDHHAQAKADAYKAHQSVCAMERRHLLPVTEAESLLKMKIGQWDIEQRRIREAAERQAREEAERIRIEEIEAAAVTAEAEGASVDEVRAIIEQPVISPKVYVPPTYQPAKGVSTATTYQADVYDVKALCRGIAEGTVSPNLVIPNLVALNQMARAMKTTFSVPGVRVVEVTNVRAGRR